ncbi:MAG: hypothetical protein JWP40_3923 [Blastococcus sp.]|jgi:hypothetical protein|nr:hypothetical protein [Blastococcus sp.]
MPENKEQPQPPKRDGQGDGNFNKRGGQIEPQVSFPPPVRPHPQPEPPAGEDKK